MTTKRVFVTGKVQGVGYRNSCFKEASRLGLKGWVRNLPDGRVEILVSGPDSEVEALLIWAKRGPFLARVKALDVIVVEEEWKSVDGEGFLIRRDEH